MDGIADILHYWFEGVDDAVLIRKKAMPFRKWFRSGPRMDEDIKMRFEGVLKRAAAGRYPHWQDSMRGRLALILLFDQFSRHIYRHTPQMFAYDDLAVRLTLRCLHEHRDQELQLIERIFLYMPLMHAESLEYQEMSVECFKRLVKEARRKYPHNAAYYQSHLSYARRYHQTIQRYGHFPHRKARVFSGFRKAGSQGIIPTPCPASGTE